MQWDFRGLIRRGVGRWPRDWREASHLPRPPAASGPRAAPAPPPEADERWITPPWQPRPDADDDWKRPA